MVINNGNQRIQLLNALLIVVSLVAAFGLGEGIVRLSFADRLIVHEEERALLYRYDRKLGWFPLESSTNTFTGSRTIMVTHNSRGFRDDEHHPGKKPGLLFIGDSFVWGYDVEVTDRFTEKLRPLLPDWDVFNLGVSGYSTDQELLLLESQFDYYHPRIVFLVICTYNDDIDNSSNNIGQGAYYKPYFIVNQNMELKGIPVPTSLSYFARQHPWLVKSHLVRFLVKAFAPPMVTVADPTTAILRYTKKFVDQKGSVLLVGLVEPHVDMENFLRAEGIPYVQLYGAERFASQGWHWTPEGHTTVSNGMFDFLRAQGLLSHAAGKRR